MSSPNIFALEMLPLDRDTNVMCVVVLVPSPYGAVRIRITERWP